MKRSLEALLTSVVGTFFPTVTTSDGLVTDVVNKNVLSPNSKRLKRNDDAKNTADLVAENAIASQEFMCPCCLEIQVQPMILVPCAHTFCRSCLLDLDEEGQPTDTKTNICYTCRSEIKSIIPNRAFENTIQAMTSSKTGCIFIESDLLNYHERTCIVQQNEKAREEAKKKNEQRSSAQRRRQQQQQQQSQQQQNQRRIADTRVPVVHHNLQRVFLDDPRFLRGDNLRFLHSNNQARQPSATSIGAATAARLSPPSPPLAATQRRSSMQSTASRSITSSTSTASNNSRPNPQQQLPSRNLPAISPAGVRPRPARVTISTPRVSRQQVIVPAGIFATNQQGQANVLATTDTDVARQRQPRLAASTASSVRLQAPTTGPNSEQHPTRRSQRIRAQQQQR